MSYKYSGCKSLSNIKIPSSLTKIEERVFFGCRGLKTIVFSEGLKVICKNAFQGCSGLTSLDFPSNLESIRDGAFMGCVGLSSLYIPDNVKYIGDNAFRELNLKDIFIGNGVTEIGDAAFKNCTELSTVTLGSSLKYLGPETFLGCEKLSKIICLRNKPSITNLYSMDHNGAYSRLEPPFEENHYTWTDVYVPYGCSETYKQGTADRDYYNFWRKFISIIEMEPDNILDCSKDSIEHVDVFSINGTKTNFSKTGINIIRFSDGTAKKVLIK